MAERYGDDTNEPTPCGSRRGELELLGASCSNSAVDIDTGEANRCLGFLSPFFRKRLVVVRREPITVEIDARDLAKICAETITALEKYSEVLGLTLQDLNAKLFSTVEFMRTALVSGHQLPSFFSTALLRTSLRSFLHHNVELPRDPGHADTAPFQGEEWLVKKAKEVIDRLVDPRGPLLVGLGGHSGLGKTCVASQVVSDKCIAANFPGGAYCLAVGHDPDLMSLQALLWKKMWGGFVSFSSPEEGNAALMSRLSEGLPSLVVLDDVWDPAHVRPFIFFDGNDKGRLLVISHDVRSTLAEWGGDVFVQIMSPLDEQEAICLFHSIAAYTDPEKSLTMAALARKCAGVPRLIQAAASILYYEKEAEAFTLPCVVSLLKQDIHADLNSKPAKKRSSVWTDVSKEEENPEHEDVLIDCLYEADSTSHFLLLPFFNALAEVHPCLQACFLDLAAFPKGQWVSLSTLVDIWGLGDEMEKERIFLVLSLLASRSLIEWKVEAVAHGGVDALNPLDEEDSLLQWRLAGEFYELAQALNERRLKETSGSSAVDYMDEGSFLGRYGPGSYTCEQTIGMFNNLQSAVEAFGTFAGLDFKNGTSTHAIPGTCCVHECSHSRLDDIHAKMKNQCFSNRGGTTFYNCRPLKSHLSERDCRLFIPGWKFEQCPTRWIEGNLSNKATKLSLVSGSMVEVPSGIEFSSLKVALLSSNMKLRSISASTMKCMEQLVVLDLKKCILLSLLPDSICTLQSLELLDLSSCTHLKLLPQSIGKLRNLKNLRLSGCLSLTCLPKSLGSLSSLAMLDLSMCARLKRLPRTIGHLSSLQNLNLFGCYSLQCLPTSLASLRKLTVLELSGCSNLYYPLPWFEQVKILAGWQNSGAMALPIDFWKLGQIEVLHLCSLKNLTYLPRSVGKLQHLRHLNLSSCRFLEFLPDDLGSLFLLQKLDLSYTAIRKLPNTIGHLSSLVALCLRGCSRLLCIPSSISALLKLEVLEMAECWDFVMLPGELGNAHSLPKLLELDLSGCSIKQLPHFSAGALPKLRRLHLSGCQNLFSLPETFGTLTSLERIDFEGCKSLASLQGTGFAELKQLQWFSLRNCFTLSTLPVSELANLQSLKFLDVSGCSGLSPFPEPLLQCAREHRFTLIRWGTVWH